MIVSWRLVLGCATLTRWKLQSIRLPRIKVGIRAQKLIMALQAPMDLATDPNPIHPKTGLLYPPLQVRVRVLEIGLDLGLELELGLE
jgi:hypothetical protein